MWIGRSFLGRKLRLGEEALKVVNSGTPAVALIFREALQQRQSHRLAVSTLEFDRAGNGRNVREW